MPLFRKDIWKYQLREAMIYWLAVPGAVIFSGLLLDRLFRLKTQAGSAWRTGAAVLLLAAGLWFIWRSTADLARYGNGTPNPRRPPRRLVTGGIYQRCRHPMFFGYDLAALAVVLLFGSPAMLCISFPVFLVMQVRFLRKEEQYLLRRYGEAFAAYKGNVPFLVPFSPTGEHKKCNQ